MIDNYVMLDSNLREQLNYLYELVVKSPVNVTAIKSRDEFALKHVLDSLYYFLKKPMKIRSMLDLGSGGGFPGLVLALYYPEWRVTLVDSIAKKCAFMEDAANKLGLKNVRVINARAETLPAGVYDLVTARGVGSVKEVLNYTLHLVHDKGSWLMYKGEKLLDELDEAHSIIEKRGLISEIFRVETPFTRSYLHLHY